MCQVTDRILEEGKKEGKREGKREQARLTVLNLAKMGMSVEKIAEIVEVNIGLVENWVKEKKMV